jgi:hypothetical protein
MNTEWIKCKNENCNNKLRVQLDDSSEPRPILFCTELCLHSVLNKKQKSDENFNYDDPKEIRELVQNLIAQTKGIQNELENLKRIRKTYFGLFKDYELKDEIYKRKWSFKDEVKE